MIWNENPVLRHPLTTVAGAIAGFRRRRRAGISVSRLPRGERRRRVIGLCLGIVAAALGSAAADHLLRDLPRPESWARRNAAEACAAKATCVEWQVAAKCAVPWLFGRDRTRTLRFRAFGRDSQEAAWMIAHFERDCVIERVDYLGPILPSRRPPSM